MMKKLETIKKNHQQSEHHSSGPEQLEEIFTSFLSPKGKNVDIPFLYAFLILDYEDFILVSRSLEDGVSTSAVFVQ